MVSPATSQSSRRRRTPPPGNRLDRGADHDGVSQTDHHRTVRHRDPPGRIVRRGPASVRDNRRRHRRIHARRPANRDRLIRPAIAIDRIRDDDRAARLPDGSAKTAVASGVCRVDLRARDHDAEQLAGRRRRPRRVRCRRSEEWRLPSAPRRFDRKPGHARVPIEHRLRHPEKGQAPGHTQSKSPAAARRG